MKSLFRKAPLIVFIAVATSILVTPSLFGKIEDNIKKSFPVEPGGKLTVETDIGSIEIKTADSRAVDIEVIREVRTNRTREADEILEDFQIKFYQDGNDVYIKAEYERTSWQKFWDNLRNRLRVKYFISVPSNYNVDLNTKGGSITVEDLVGDVRCKTSGGSLRFYRIQGPVWGKTSGGSIKLTSSTGSAELRTSGGSITVEEVQGAIKAKSSGGTVRACISEQPEKACRLTTSGGSVIIHMADNIAVDVDARTSGGRVHTEFPVKIQGTLSKRSLMAKINGGGPELYLRSSGGNIYLKKM